MVLVLSSNLYGQTDKKIELSKQLLTAFQKSDFDKVMTNFDATMKTALPKEKLKEIWTSLEKQCGAFVKSGEITTDKFQTYDIVYILCEFKNVKLNMKTVFDTKGQIAGLFFVPENQK
jgi:hypothetical protein